MDGELKSSNRELGSAKLNADKELNIMCKELDREPGEEQGQLMKMKSTKVIKKSVKATEKSTMKKI